MLGHWRIALRQAEESAKAGRIEEALALSARPDVSDHRQAVSLRGRLAKELVVRSARRAEADDRPGALADLKLAERNGVAPDALAAARLKLAIRFASEIGRDLEAGDPERVLAKVEGLASEGVSNHDLRRFGEIASAWKTALEEQRRGEFGRAREALDRAGRLADGLDPRGIDAAHRDLEDRQKAAAPAVERLYKALADGKDWAAILAASESLLESTPDHPAARQARAKAWQQISAIAPTAQIPGRSSWRAAPPDLRDPMPTQPQPDQPRPRPRPFAPGIVFLDEPGGVETAGAPRRPFPAGPRGRSLLWADAVGGYLVCMDGEVVLGRDGPDSAADVPFLGDLSRRHASIVRQGDGYTLRAHQPTWVNGRPVTAVSTLRDRDVIRLGNSVEVMFRQPSPVSATARLEIVSRHRLPMAVEGVILMAETCIVGGSPQAHVPAPHLAQPVVLFRQGGDLWCRVPGSFEVDGKSYLSRAPLGPHSHVQTPEFTFSLEPMAPRAAIA